MKGERTGIAGGRLEVDTPTVGRWQEQREACEWLWQEQRHGITRLPWPCTEVAPEASLHFMYARIMGRSCVVYANDTFPPL